MDTIYVTAYSKLVRKREKPFRYLWEDSLTTGTKWTYSFHLITKKRHKSCSKPSGYSLEWFKYTI